MGHGSPGGNPVHFIGQGAGRTGTAADIGRSGADNGPVRPLGPAGAKLQHGTALGRTDDSIGLGGNHGLMVQGQKHIGLDELGLNGGGADGQNRLLGKHRRALRHGVNVPGKAEISQIVQKILVKNVLFPEKCNVLPVKMQLLDVLHNLLQARRNGIAAPIGNRPEEHVKVGDFILKALLKIAVSHGQLIKVAEHGQVSFVHGFLLPCTWICRLSITSRAFS